MLSRLLTLIKSNRGIISQEDLCEALDVSPEMLEGMIYSLIRMGYLIEIIDNNPSSCSSACDDCVLIQQCNLMNLFQERRFEVVDTIHHANPK